MQQSVPLRQRQDAALTPTNRGAPVGVIPSASDSTPSADSGPLLSVPARVPRSFASRSEVPQHPVEPSANRRASVRGNHRPPLTAVVAATAHQRCPSPPSRRRCRIAPLPTQTNPVPAGGPEPINRHLGTPEPGPSRHHRNPASSQTTNGATLDLLCLSSTSPVNPGLPSSGILAPVEPALRRPSPAACR